MSGYPKSKINRSPKQLTQTGYQVWERSQQRYSRSRNNLWGLTLFLLISIYAFYFRDFNLFEAASEPVRQLLGYPPSASIVGVALAIYCLSSAVLTLTAMANDERPASTWKQLGYRCAFYPFYIFSGSLSDNFILVLGIGLGLYALDQCHIWIYNSKAVQEQKELLGRF